MKQIHTVNKVPRTIIRFLLIILGAILMATNINTFVNSVGLFPGGFTGIALLIRECFAKFFNIKLPFSFLYWLLNSVPAIISFKFIGKKFTLYSCLMIVLSGLFTDYIPGFHITDEILLCSIFGGLVNGFAISLCLFADATSGGTDFIAIFVSEKTGNNAWNYIFFGNVIILLIAGLLFGFERALYSIIFQFASTQALNFLYKKYSKTTMLIITDKDEEIYQKIKEITNHDATLFIGKGCYQGVERKMLYTVVSTQESTKLIKEIKKIDSSAFINLLETKELLGRFFSRPND
jgi:uncharacterized membrane-anchored protein YitT (DUF2179 family)